MPRRSLALTFPRDLSLDEVTAFVRALALAGSRRLISIEVHASETRIEHVIAYPAELHERIISSLRAHLPAVRVQNAQSNISPALGVRIGGTSTRSTLRADGVAAALLSALAEVRRGEVVVVQWLVSPMRQPPGPDAPPSMTRIMTADLLGLPRDISQRERAARKRKLAEPLLACFGRVAAGASTHGRQHHLLTAVADAMRQASEPGSRLRVSRPSRKTAELVAVHRPGLLEAPLQLNATEFAGISGWPIDVGATPGLTRGVARTLPAPRTDGDTVIARTVGTTSTHPITAGVEDRLHHLHLLGPTGVGKSHLITQLASQDAAAGRGLIVIDPKGDLVDDIIKRLPQDRLDDVIVIDPGDGDRVVGFNPLNAEPPELVVDQLVSVLHDLYRSSWGPRTADVLRATLTTLTVDSAQLEPDQRWTLIDVPAVLTDDRLRRTLHTRRNGHDPDLEGYWKWYESLSAPERSQVIAPVLNKLRAITLRPSLRNTLGQSQGIQLGEILQDSKILLVSLRRSTLGPESARLLGSLLVSQLWNAVTARASISRAARTPTFVYLDEVQDLLHTPVDLGDALAQARGLGVGFTLAHQHLDQLGSDLRAAVMANARSKIAFRLSHDDSRRMAREFEPELTVDDLKGLPAREMALQLLVRGDRVVATGIADALPRAIAGQLGPVRDQSSRRYGMERPEIDEAIRKRRDQRPQHRGPPGREPA